ncbi:hypothetical protein [Streptomyces sp. NPDC002402]
MSATRRSAATALMAAAAVSGTLLATAAPAQAAVPAKQCKTSTKMFALPGKPDVKVSATICIQRLGYWGGLRHYKAWLSKVSWDGTSSWYIGGDRFNDIHFLPRAQHGRTVVKNCGYGICEENYLTTEINNREKGSKTFKSGADGFGIVWVHTKAKNWLADATAWYDIADDGKPTKTWDLSATRAVY